MVNLVLDTFSLFGSAIVRTMNLILTKFMPILQISVSADSRHFSQEKLRYHKNWQFFYVCIFWLRFDIEKYTNKTTKIIHISLSNVSLFPKYIFFHTHFTTKYNKFILTYRVVLLTGPPKNFLSTKSLYNCWHLGEIPGQFAWDPVLRKFRGGPVKRTTLYIFT